MPDDDGMEDYNDDYGDCGDHDDDVGDCDDVDGADGVLVSRKSLIDDDDRWRKR